MIEFIYQFDETSPKISMVLHPSADLREILEQFELFLKGAGYVFDGKIDLIETEGSEK